MTIRPFNFDELILAVDSHHGIYSAQIFVQQYGDSISMLSDEDKAILLQGPENEDYIETWADLLAGSFTFVNVDGKNYQILEMEDIWLLPEDMEFPESW